MAETKVFDASQYTRLPSLDIRQGIALAISLLSAAPKNASERIKKAAQKVHDAVLDLQDGWRKKQRAAQAAKKPAEKRLADGRSDTGWGALKGRIDDYARLPVDRFPRAARAAELSYALFPNGLQFLTLAMEKQWAVGEDILKQIKEDNLQADIDLIAGPEFLDEVRAAQANYGEALGITKAAPLPEGEELGSLLDPLRALTQAIDDYVLQICASVDRDDPATITAARNALQPIDRLRESMARRAKNKKAEEPEAEPDVTPDTPVPAVEA